MWKFTTPILARMKIITGSWKTIPITTVSDVNVESPEISDQLPFTMPALNVIL